MLYLKVLINALQSDEVKEEAKASLVACLYSHTLQEITTAADEVFTKAAGKVNRDKPAQVLFVLTSVCGFEGDPRNAATSSVPKGR
ncbi:hypothetical protein [Novosphingobium panipatense]|uniref:hypothetical protein n=1 Tax=Novosphingobium panipatense TaxID=428991 RepID=UPI0036132FC4